ncbi:MAG: hypothetical protein PHU27_00735 [Salinivirgaceae bacterium]|nr:hypothetical protein [Salinivirgaceae bacterium]MDD4746356.1 hypothetical protein [Salinivirgaceae bacterium]
MESFNVNLNKTSEKGGRYKRFLIIISAVLIGITLITFTIFYLNGVHNKSVYIIPACYLITFIYFAFKGRKTALYINADLVALEYQLGFYRHAPIAILWQTIKKVKLGPTYISFFKRSNKRKTIYLGWLPYTKIIEIKSNVERMCKTLNIDIEYGEIIRDIDVAAPRQ